MKKNLRKFGWLFACALIITGTVVSGMRKPAASPAPVEKRLKVELTTDQWGQTLQALAKLPLEQSLGTYMAILEQLQTQGAVDKVGAGNQPVVPSAPDSSKKSTKKP